jgi:hypothetical protein
MECSTWKMRSFLSYGIPFRQFPAWKPGLMLISLLALSPDLDPTRIIERALSDVQTK